MTFCKRFFFSFRLADWNSARCDCAFILNYVVNIKSGNEAARKQQIFMLLCEIKQ